MIDGGARLVGVHGIGLSASHGSAAPAARFTVER
jgi:hypothetical protein